MVAEGSVDLAAEPELALHDMAALDVTVREAGGRFSSLDGREGPTGGKALASNGILHETVLGFLGSVGPDSDRPAPYEEPADRSELDPGEGEGRVGTVFDLSSRRRPPQEPAPR